MTGANTVPTALSVTVLESLQRPLAVLHVGVRFVQTMHNLLDRVD
jgi:hypothetical protein